MDRHSDADLRLPFGLQSSPTHPTPWQKRCSLLRTKCNCFRVTALGFTQEHLKPNLRNRTRIFHPVTACVRIYPSYRHSGPKVLTLSLSLFLFPASPFTSIVTIAIGNRTPFARHECISHRSSQCRFKKKKTDCGQPGLRDQNLMPV